VKIGAEDKTKVRVMVAVLAVAALVILYNVLGSSSSAAAPQSDPTQSAAKKPAPDNSLDPTIRLEILRASQSVTYRDGGRNIFRMEEPKIIQPIGPVRPTDHGTQTKLPPNPDYVPPDIPLKFYGFASNPGEPKRIFLWDAGSVFIAREGDIIDRRYKVVQISNASVMIEDVLTNFRKPIALTSQP
jgi:hypothetical protein